MTKADAVHPSSYLLDDNDDADDDEESVTCEDENQESVQEALLLSRTIAFGTTATTAAPWQSSKVDEAGRAETAVGRTTRTAPHRHGRQRILTRDFHGSESERCTQGSEEAVGCLFGAAESTATMDFVLAAMSHLGGATARHSWTTAALVVVGGDVATQPVDVGNDSSGPTNWISDAVVVRYRPRRHPPGRALPILILAGPLASHC